MRRYRSILAGLMLFPPQAVPNSPLPTTTIPLPSSPPSALRSSQFAEQESRSMAEGFMSLPPSKRYKILHQEQSMANPSLLSVNRTLPSKKRFLSNFLHLPETTYCLPAKKRILAPHPLSVTNLQEKEATEISTEKEEVEVKGEKVEEKEEQNVVKKEEEKGEEVDLEEEEDDGVVCDVCKSADGDPSDPIVFCDGCDVMVHASCYGNPLVKSIPDGDWFCSVCQSKDDTLNLDVINCCLCPVEGGAMKPTTDGKWAHILCALFVPEVFFKDPAGRDGVDLSKVPIRRWKGKCCLCGSSHGCVIECSEPKCELQFHVSCGLEKELCLEYRDGKNGGLVVGFCEDHSKIWEKQQLTGKFKIVPREQHQGKRKT